MSRLGDQIKSARLAQGISQRVLAKKCGVSEGYLNEVESGRRIVNDDVAARFLKALGRPTDDLVPQPEPVVNEAIDTPAPRRVETAPVKPTAPVEPSDTWRQALSALVKPVPIMDADGIQIGTMAMAVENGKIRDFAADKVLLYQVGDDLLRSRRLYRNDRVLILPDKSLRPGVLLFIEINGKRMLRVLKEYNSGKLVLSCDKESLAISEKEVTLLGRASLVMFEL